MSFRTWDFHLQPWHLVVPMACVGAIDRDYVSIASGLGAVTGMQESKESLKGKKILSPLMVGGCWWVIQLHSQGRICVLLSTKPLNRFLPLRDGKLTELMLTLKRGGIWEPFASRKKIWTVSQYVRTSTKKLYLVSHGFHEDNSFALVKKESQVATGNSQSATKFKEKSCSGYTFQTFIPFVQISRILLCLFMWYLYIVKSVGLSQQCIFCICPVCQVASFYIENLIFMKCQAVDL